ncbi:MAG: rhodanese-like domain-containing protein [Betaproteobacteria bacterium]|nr:rhodanese-like domain-containing protein [Betaproteobacteria bacterium]
MMAVVSGALFIWPTISKRLSGAKHVSAFEAVQLINRKDAVVVDVREPAEFKSAHVANSRNIPFGELESKLKELEKFKDRPILLLCQAGNRSATATGTLKKAGFMDVAALAGGLAAWQQAGMPVSKSS